MILGNFHNRSNQNSWKNRCLWIERAHLAVLAGDQNLLPGAHRVAYCVSGLIKQTFHSCLLDMGGSLPRVNLIKHLRAYFTSVAIAFNL